MGGCITQPIPDDELTRIKYESRTANQKQKQKVASDEQEFEDELHLDNEIVDLITPQQAASYPYNCIGLIVGKN